MNLFPILKRYSGFGNFCWIVADITLLSGCNCLSNVLPGLDVLALLIPIRTPFRGIGIPGIIRIMRVSRIIRVAGVVRVRVFRARVLRARVLRARVFRARVLRARVFRARVFRVGAIRVGAIRVGVGTIRVTIITTTVTCNTRSIVTMQEDGINTVCFIIDTMFSLASEPNVLKQSSQHSKCGEPPELNTYQWTHVFTLSR